MPNTRVFTVRHPAGRVREFWQRVPAFTLTPEPDSVRRFDTIPATLDRLDSIDRRDLADHLGLDSRDGVWGDEE